MMETNSSKEKILILQSTINFGLLFTIRANNLYKFTFCWSIGLLKRKSYLNSLRITYADYQSMNQSHFIKDENLNE